MPTVLREDGFEVMIYTDDHEPPHVHMRHGGAWVIINLQDLSTRKVKKMKKSDVKRGVMLAAHHREFLMEKWSEFQRREK